MKRRISEVTNFKNRSAVPGPPVAGEYLPLQEQEAACKYSLQPELSTPHDPRRTGSR